MWLDREDSLLRGKERVYCVGQLERRRGKGGGAGVFAVAKVSQPAVMGWKGHGGSRHSVQGLGVWGEMVVARKGLKRTSWERAMRLYGLDSILYQK